MLAAFRLIDPENEYQQNSWNPRLTNAIRSVATDRGVVRFAEEKTISGLARKGYLAGEGRGKFRQFWLSEKGAAALDGAS